MTMKKKRRKKSNSRKVGDSVSICDVLGMLPDTCWGPPVGIDDEYSCIKEGTSTKKIQEYIDKSEIKCLINIYECIKAYEFKSRPSTNLPKKDIKKIIKTLKSVKDKEWLTEYSMEIIIWELKSHVFYSGKGSQYVQDYLLRKNFQSGGRKSNVALNFVILLLGNQLKRSGMRAPYVLIADFLSEQGIGDTMSSDAVRKIFNRNSPIAKTIQSKIESIEEIRHLSHDLDFNSEERHIDLPERKQLKPIEIKEIDKIIKLLDED